MAIICYNNLSTVKKNACITETTADVITYTERVSDPNIYVHL